MLLTSASYTCPALPAAQFVVLQLVTSDVDLYLYVGSSSLYLPLLHPAIPTARRTGSSSITACLRPHAVSQGSNLMASTCSYISSLEGGITPS